MTTKINKETIAQTSSQCFTKDGLIKVLFFEYVNPDLFLYYIYDDGESWEGHSHLLQLQYGQDIELLGLNDILCEYEYKNKVNIGGTDYYCFAKKTESCI